MFEPMTWVYLAASAFVGSIMAEAGPFATKYLAADDTGRMALKSQYGDWTYLGVRSLVAACVAFMATMGITPTMISAFVLGLAGLNASDFFVQRKDEVAPKGPVARGRAKDPGVPASASAPPPPQQKTGP